MKEKAFSCFIEVDCKKGMGISLKRLKNIFIPGILISGITGIVAGAAVYIFKRIASLLSEWSVEIYTFVGQRLWAIPLLFLGSLLLSAAAWLILKYCPSAMGGGIPSSVGVMRGILTMHWLKTLLATAVSAFITFFAGVPLGNEGPSVQMGTAIGSGFCSKKSRAWNRFIQTSGACAGFAAATGAPISGLLLSLEEVHKRFSPMIIFSSLSGVIGASLTTRVLGHFFGGTEAFLNLNEVSTLSLESLPIVMMIGIVAGFAAVLYSAIFEKFRHMTANIPLFPKVAAVFMLTGVIGVISPLDIGNGHHIIELLCEGEIVFWAVILLLMVKLAMTALASAAGVTGGLFIPMLAIGGLLGGIEAHIIALLGVDSSICLPVILISVAAFLSAAMKTPFMAIVFSMEALFCTENILFVAVAAVLGYLITELMGSESITEIVLKGRINEQTAGKKQVNVELSATIQAGAFAEGKAVRDILMPENCVIVSLIRGGVESAVNDGDKILCAGDVLNMHCITYDESALHEDIAALFN